MNNYKLLFVLFLIIIQKQIIIIKFKSQTINKKKIENKTITNKEKINLNKTNIWNKTYFKNEMHTYGLYNEFKLPQISMVLTIDNCFILNESYIKQQLENAFLQNFSNMEIILSVKKHDAIKYNITKNIIPKFIFEQKNFIVYNNTNQTETFTNLINIISGAYTIFINDFNILKKINISQIFNYTIGKIDNYFNISITDEQTICLMRTKVLKDLNDNGIKFNSIYTILNIVKSLFIPQLNYISISLCPDNNYSKLAYVAMSSILSSKAINTYICFYLIISKDFKKRNKLFLESLYEVYDYFNLTFIMMDSRYDKAYTGNVITIQTYFRFSLGELLTNWNKTIYIDTDIIVYKDLSNFYNLNFNGKLFLGHPTIGNRKGFISVNNGILLLNLFGMRKCKIENKAIEIIKKQKVLRYHDQTVLNRFFNNYIGLFPPEYHARPLGNYKEMEFVNNKMGNIFDKDYFYFAHKYPTIRHFLGNYKPRNPNINHIEDWWFFARKSKYYNENADRFENAFSF